MRILLLTILLSNVALAEGDFLGALNKVHENAEPVEPIEVTAEAKRLAYQQRLQYRRMRALDLRRQKYAGRRHVYPIYNPGIPAMHGAGRIVHWHPVYAGGATY